MPGELRSSASGQRRAICGRFSRAGGGEPWDARYRSACRSRSRIALVNDGWMTESRALQADELQVFPVVAREAGYASEPSTKQPAALLACVACRQHEVEVKLRKSLAKR